LIKEYNVEPLMFFLHSGYHYITIESVLLFRKIKSKCSKTDSLQYFRWANISEIIHNKKKTTKMIIIAKKNVGNLKAKKKR